jgi:hypothetical protein
VNISAFLADVTKLHDERQATTEVTVGDAFKAAAHALAAKEGKSYSDAVVLLAEREPAFYAMYLSEHKDGSEADARKRRLLSERGAAAYKAERERGAREHGDALEDRALFHLRHGNVTTLSEGRDMVARELSEQVARRSAGKEKK